MRWSCDTFLMKLRLYYIPCDMEWIRLIKQFYSISSHFLLTKNQKKISCSGFLHQAQCPTSNFYPSPPEETHFMKHGPWISNGIEVSMEWRKILRQGRAYSVTLPPAFSHQQGYKIMPRPSKDFFVSSRRPKGVICFSNLKKKYTTKLSWAWNVNFPPITVKCYRWEILISMEYFFWRLGDLKNTSHFLKKDTFSTCIIVDNKFRLLIHEHVWYMCLKLSTYLYIISSSWMQLQFLRNIILYPRWS